MNKQTGFQKYAESIDSHYGQSNLDEKILAALQDAGKDVDSLTINDLQTFDQIHIGGVEGTRVLAQLVGLQEGNHVLDIGCGLGGPARTLATEFGCTVTGLEITEAFYQAAEMLTLRVGLSSQVSFRLGNALNLPFNDGMFDVVWMQHVAMNIPDKNALFTETSRVLKPGGTLALHTILAGEVLPIHYPVVWAADPGIDFIEPASAFRKAIEDSGLETVVWKDVTQRETSWFKATFAKGAKGNTTPPISALFIDNLMEKAKNTLHNLEEGRIAVVEVVYRKDGAP